MIDECDCAFFNALPPEEKAVNRRYRHWIRRYIINPEHSGPTDIPDDITASMCGECVYAEQFSAGAKIRQEIDKLSWWIKHPNNDPALYPKMLLGKPAGESSESG